jgi:alkylation response protein AidB-like acyl-CoA dehydrogenase
VDLRRRGGRLHLAGRPHRPDLPRHKGISILILDTTEAGFSHTVIPTCSNPTAATYYDNVKVPADMLVGKLNGGWKLITSQLNHERLGLGAWSDKVVGLFRRVLLWAKARTKAAAAPSTAPGCAACWPSATPGWRRCA